MCANPNLIKTFFARVRMVLNAKHFFVVVTLIRTSAHIRTPLSAERPYKNHLRFPVSDSVLHAVRIELHIFQRHRSKSGFQ